MSRALAIATAVLGAVWVAVVLGTAVARLGHPFELEWMGGAFVDHVCRLIDGESLYVAPSADYVPFLYGPLYFQVSAWTAALVGEGFVPLRLVSIAATVATWALLFALVRGRTGRAAPAIAAVGIYAAGYVVVDTWYDISRADSLFVALTTATMLALDRTRGPRGALAAAALLTLAYLAKQTALLLAPPFAIALAIRTPRAGLWFALAFAGLWGATNAALSAVTDGWYWFYTWTLPREHEYVTAPLWTFWRHDLMPLWPALAVALFWAVRGLLDPATRRATLADGAIGLGLLLAALSSRMHVGGAINVVMPAILSLAWLAGLAWPHGRTAGSRLALVPAALVVLQLAGAWVEFGTTDDPHRPRLFQPARYVPDAADRAAGERLVAILREADGEVLVPFHGYLPRMAGKRGSAHAMALLDVQRSGAPELAARLVAEFHESARARDAAVVVLEDNLGPVELVHPGYRFVERIVASDEPTFYPKVGLASRPVVVFRRKD